MSLIFIFIGAGIGGSLRYIVSQLMSNLIKHPFPFATFFVNILGSFLIGILFKIAFSNSVQETKIFNFITQFLITGFLGGFTTFSSFSLDFMKLIQNGDVILGIAYAFSSILLSFIFVFIGYKIFSI